MCMHDSDSATRSFPILGSGAARHESRRGKRDFHSRELIRLPVHVTSNYRLRPYVFAGKLFASKSFFIVLKIFRFPLLEFLPFFVKG